MAAGAELELRVLYSKNNAFTVLTLWSLCIQVGFTLYSCCMHIAFTQWSLRASGTLCIRVAFTLCLCGHSCIHAHSVVTLAFTSLCIHSRIYVTLYSACAGHSCTLHAQVTLHSRHIHIAFTSLCGHSAPTSHVLCTHQWSMTIQPSGRASRVGCRQLGCFCGWLLLWLIAFICFQQ